MGKRQRNPGRTRIKLAELLNKEFGTQIQPEDIWDNNYPAAKWLDLARWGVDAEMPDGYRRNIHSWDRMGEIVKHGVVEVDRDSLGMEVTIKERERMHAHLEIYSYAGIVLDARHYMGSLKIAGREFGITRKLTASEAKQLNKDEQQRAGGGKFHRYSVGSESGRFQTEEALVEAAIAMLQADHPEITVLLRGPSYNPDPLPVLLAPEPLKTQLNALVAEAEAIDWWDKDEAAMRDICDRWETLKTWQ